MIVRALNLNHMKEIINLEEVALGVQTTKDMRKHYSSILSSKGNNSIGIFTDGKLIGFFIAEDIIDKENYSEITVIRNAIIKSKKALLYSLLYFQHNYYTFRNVVVPRNEIINCDIDKLNAILKKINPKIKTEINTFNGVESLYVKNKEVKCFNNIKHQVIRKTFNNNDFGTTLHSVFYDLLFVFGIDKIIENKKFILNTLNNINKDYLKMFGTKILFSINTYRKVWAEDPTAFINKLEDLGYKHKVKHKRIDNKEMAVRYNRTYRFSKHGWRRFYNFAWTNTIQLDDAHYTDQSSISFYRYIFKKYVIGFARKNKKDDVEVIIYDKYGEFAISLSAKSNDIYGVPRISENVFNSLVKKHYFVEKYKKKMTDCGFHNELVNECYMSQAMLRIRKYVSEDVAIKYLDKFCEYIKNNYELCNKTYNENLYREIHDWSYAVIELIDHNKLLTKGAISHIILNKSLNQIIRIKDLLSAIECQNHKYYDIKVIRKQISSSIKKNIDIEPIIFQLVHEIENKWLKSKKISKKMLVEFNEFLDKMRRYSPNMSIKRLFATFGADMSKQIVKGEYKGLFNEYCFESNMKELGLLVQKVLKGGLVKHPKKLYNSLSKIQNVQEIVEGNIKKNNIISIVNELKQRNVKVDKAILEASKLTAKIEKKCSPEFLMAGNASVCCMSFGNNNAISYAKEKGFGVFNIYYKDRVIANSVIWINEPYNCLVIDNAEVHPNYIKFNDIIKGLYNNMIDYVLENYKLDFAVQGKNYNDLKLYEQLDFIHFKEIKPVMVEEKNFYTDANSVYLLSNGKLNYDEMLNKLNNSNIKSKVNKTTDTFDFDIAI